METPKTKAGTLTERIMLRVSERLPTLTTQQYNHIYSSVLAELSLQFPEADSVRFPGGGGMFIERRKR